MSSLRWYIWIAAFAVTLSWSVSLDSPVARGVVHGVVIVSALWVGRFEGHKDVLTGNQSHVRLLENTDDRKGNK